MLCYTSVLGKNPMPFKSQAQRRFMYSQHPEIAKRWSKEYPNQGKLPEKKTDSGAMRGLKSLKK